MTKPKRNRRAKNKIGGSAQKKAEGSPEGALVKADPVLESDIAVQRFNAAALPRVTIFTAEFEQVIEIIARERVYRAMLDRLARRLLMAPPNTGDVFNL
jgi:hypothetical protein